MNKTHGFSLYEVLIALALGVLVVGLLFKIIFHADKAWHVQQEQVETIEKALAIKALITQGVEQAGNLGCGTYTQINVIDHTQLYVGVRPWFYIAEDKISVMYLSQDARAIDSQVQSNALVVKGKIAIKKLKAMAPALAVNAPLTIPKM